MIAAVYKDIKQIKIANDYPLRKLKSGEVLIKVAYCGICGTDKHIFEGKAPSKKNIILGHEFSGTVADFAEGVSSCKIEDKVAIDPNIYCGQCIQCKKGNIQFCENHQALGVTLDGGFAEYSIVPVAQVYKLPDEVDLSQAAFAEPLSCCLRGVQHADIKHGNSVVIIGGGAIGLIMLQLAKLAGAAEVVVIEPEKSKREFALELGADFSFSPFENNIENIIKNIAEGGADVVIECAGKKEAAELSIRLSARGGKVVIFGLSPKDEKASLDLQYIFNKELQINCSAEQCENHS